MYYFIIHEGARSGKGKEVWQVIENKLQQRGTVYLAQKTEYAGHASILAEEITKELHTTISLIAIGGDGTVNEVINGIQDFNKVRFGVIPVGSGNDYARGLKLIDNPEKILTKLLDHPEYSRIDLGLVYWNHRKNKRYYAISSGIGLDALVSKKALTSPLKKLLNKIRLGKLTYLILTVQTLFTMETAEADLNIENQVSVSMKNTIFLAGMNFKAEGGGVPMAPHALKNDGKLDICAAFGIPKWKTFFLLPLLALGKHEHIHGFRILRTTQCQIQTSIPMVVHTDGEYCVTTDNIEYLCLPKQLKIIH